MECGGIERGGENLRRSREMKGEGERYSCKGKGKEMEGEREVVPGQFC